MKTACTVAGTTCTSVAARPAAVSPRTERIDCRAIRSRARRRKPTATGASKPCRSLAYRKFLLFSAAAKQNALNRRDQHRRSLEGYDLNNVAGVVKIETLPAGALEEESTAFDDGGEEFCVVMSKRGRKEQKAAQLSKQNASESNAEPVTKTASIDNDEQQANEVNPSSFLCFAPARFLVFLPETVER